MAELLDRDRARRIRRFQRTHKQGLAGARVEYDSAFSGLTEGCSQSLHQICFNARIASRLTRRKAGANPRKRWRFRAKQPPSMVPHRPARARSRSPILRRPENRDRRTSIAHPDRPRHRRAIGDTIWLQLISKAHAKWRSVSYSVWRHGDCVGQRNGSFSGCSMPNSLPQDRSIRIVSVAARPRAGSQAALD